MTMPALFISHGSPELAVHDSPAHRFLSGYAKSLPRPRRVLVVSAHWETDEPVVATGSHPRTVHDFRGFDRRLYDIRYPAAGDPELALEAAALLQGADFDIRADPEHGWDHGVWVPLHLLFPAGDVTVAQLSIQPAAGPEHHLKIGQALAPLRARGVMIVASGAMTHNLREYFSDEPQSAPAWVTAFTDWMHSKLEGGKIDELLDYRRLAPYAARNHPEEEHLLPLFVPLGTVSPSEPVRRVHTSIDRVIAMDVYQFGQ
jgi:4,5-DOPA dioxygenase extradiol